MLTRATGKLERDEPVHALASEVVLVDSSG